MNQPDVSMGGQFGQNALSFTQHPLPGKTLFGAGRIDELGPELQDLGIARALLICSSGRVDMAVSLMERADSRIVALYPKAKMHVPYDGVQEALELVQEERIDGAVAFGGGSAIGLAKALALECGIPIAAIPTTYSGSEMTPIWGITRSGNKETGRDLKVAPRTVIYDPDLFKSLPFRVAGPSAMNAMAHCIESLYARSVSPFISALTLEGISALGEALDQLIEDPENSSGQEKAIYGGWLGGICLGSTEMALHHKICHVLGGKFDLPHAELHTLMLPYSATFNLSEMPDVMEKVAIALKTEDVPKRLFEISRSIIPKTSLKYMGVPIDKIDETIDLALSNPYYNPRPLNQQNLTELLMAAYQGLQPVP